MDGHPIGEVTRDSAAARAALAGVVQPLFANGSPTVQAALAGAVGRLRLADAAPLLLAKVGSGSTAEVRTASLGALQALGGARAEEAIRTSLQDPDRTVRAAALAAVARAGLPETTTAELLSSVLSQGTVTEQQTALAALGQLQGAGARRALARLLDQLDRGAVAPEIQLDVAEAARASRDPALVARLDARDAARASRPSLDAYADALHGGDAQAGQRTINNNAAAQCNQCHVISGAATGSRVGPDLRSIALRLTREQLLEALVHPNARIAPGYGPVSVMPPMGGVLTRRELRDVVEYLTTLR
ncbi:MAG: c-type cytochrome [Gemmatimonadetes bacterium]|nr:c-type cytochrome [Gemmatimonadota bacterium]